jgi:hypothetical protein
MTAIRVRQFLDLYPRYLNAIIIMPFCAFVASFLALVIVRTAGPCLSWFVSLPSDSADPPECAEINPVGYFLAFFAVPLGNGGPFYWIFLFAPYLLAFPEVSTLRKRKNQVLLLGSILLSLLTRIAVAFTPNSLRMAVISIRRILLTSFNWIATPLIWRRDLSDRG